MPIHLVLDFSEYRTASETLFELCPESASCRFLLEINRMYSFIIFTYIIGSLVPYKVVSVIFWQWHESASHDNEFNLINAVSQLLQLVHSMLGLQIGIVTSTNRSHWSRFVPCVRLSRILEIWVWTSWTIHTNISSHVNVRTSMGLAHHCYYGNLNLVNSKINLLYILIVVMYSIL